MIEKSWYFCTGHANVQFSPCDTLWQFNNFSIAQNLREINFRDSGSAKSTVLTHLDAVNLAFLHLKAEIY